MLLLHICGWNMVCGFHICIIGNKSSAIASENDRELAKDRPYVWKEEDHIKIKNITAVWHSEGLPHTVIAPLIWIWFYNMMFFKSLRKWKHILVNTTVSFKVARSDFWVTIPFNFERQEQHHYLSNRKSNDSGVLEKDESFKWSTFHQDLSYHSNKMTPCPILHKTE